MYSDKFPYGSGAKYRWIFAQNPIDVTIIDHLPTVTWEDQLLAFYKEFLFGFILYDIERREIINEKNTFRLQVMMAVAPVRFLGLCSR